MKDFHPVPFAQVKSKGDYQNRELYVYYYAPIVFLAIEHEMGEEKMWQWLRALLETKTDFTNYVFLESTLAATLEDKDRLQQIKSQYFDSDKSLENAIARLTKN